MSSESTVLISLEEEVAIMEEIVVGFRFHPTDFELVDHYLKNKRLGRDNLVSLIPEVDVCKFEPWDLPEQSVIKSNDRVWHYFCPPDIKYPKSKRHRLNRSTEAGYWKATGKDRNVKARGTNNVIGIKKTLVFYIGRSPKGVRTDWVMHEYHPTETLPDQRDFVLCLLKDKADEKTNGTICGESEPSSFNALDEKANGTICDESEPSSFNATSCVESEPSSFNATSCVESEPSSFNALDEKANATTCDESVPSSCNTFDFENLVGEDAIPIPMEYIQPEAEPESHFQVCPDFSYAQQLPMHNQQEPPSVNGHSNDCNGMQSQFDNAQLEEDLAWYSLIDGLFWGDINSSIAYGDTAIGDNISPIAGEP